MSWFYSSSFSLGVIFIFQAFSFYCSAQPQLQLQIISQLTGTHPPTAQDSNFECSTLLSLHATSLELVLHSEFQKVLVPGYRTSYIRHKTAPKQLIYDKFYFLTCFTSVLYFNCTHTLFVLLHMNYVTWTT